MPNLILFAYYSKLFWTSLSEDPKSRLQTADPGQNTQIWHLFGLSRDVTTADNKGQPTRVPSPSQQIPNKELSPPVCDVYPTS